MTNQPTVPRMLSLNEVTEILGISRATLYRGVRNKVLPQPVKISMRRVGWRSTDIGLVVAGNFKGA